MATQRIPAPSGHQYTSGALGYAGGTYYADTSAHTGNWACIEAVTDTVFATLTGNLSSFTGVTLPAGRRIYGQFTAITLTSGSIIAYNDPVQVP